MRPQFYSIYTLKKKTRRKAVDGSWFTIPARPRYLGYASDLRSALSVATGVREMFKVPVFIGDSGSKAPTVRQ